MSQKPENLSVQQPRSMGESISQIKKLMQNVDGGEGRKIPPVDQWNPSYCGSMNLIIKSNGEWWHEGSKIQRHSLIELFSSVLWREDGQYFLKTPVEKIAIEVEDVPLLVSSVDSVTQDGQQVIQCRTTTGDVVTVGEQQPIFMREYQGQMRPYIRVRWDLEALIQRSAFYHLVELGEFVEQGQQSGVQLVSGDYQFSLMVDALS